MVDESSDRNSEAVKEEPSLTEIDDPFNEFEKEVQDLAKKYSEEKDKDKAAELFYSVVRDEKIRKYAPDIVKGDLILRRRIYVISIPAWGQIFTPFIHCFISYMAIEKILNNRLYAWLKPWPVNISRVLVN